MLVHRICGRDRDQDSRSVLRSTNLFWASMRGDHDLDESQCNSAGAKDHEGVPERLHPVTQAKALQGVAACQNVSPKGKWKLATSTQFISAVFKQ